MSHQLGDLTGLAGNHGVAHSDGIVDGCQKDVTGKQELCW